MLRPCEACSARFLQVCGYASLRFGCAREGSLIPWKEGLARLEIPCKGVRSFDRSFTEDEEEKNALSPLVNRQTVSLTPRT